MSKGWDLYKSRLNAKGSTIREAQLQKTSLNIGRKLKNSLSYYTVAIDGEERQLAIINSDNLVQKTICSLPGEDILGGSLVKWKDDFWLVTSRDPNNEIYTKATMEQCNYLLKWVSEDGVILERWVIISDGTKYQAGETSGTGVAGVTLGDTKVSLTIGRDAQTLKLNRSNRFLIDDYDSDNVRAYRLTKPFKLGGVYNGHGAMTFVLTEENTENDDNQELHIADYYKHFPRDDAEDAGKQSTTTKDQGKKVWL